MSRAELIKEIEGYYLRTTSAYLDCANELEKAELLGLMKGYKSTLILLKTLEGY